jgi:hypothetical protein
MTKTHIVVPGALLVLIATAAPHGHAAQGAPADHSARASMEKECGTCHMAYPPMFLPQRSWQALMAGLENHFGENASLGAAATRRIAAYLMANAADASGGAPVPAGLAGGETPLRITDMPWWIRAHSQDVPPGAFTSPKVKSRANCLACHTGGARGQWDIDSEGQAGREAPGDRD